MSTLTLLMLKAYTGVGLAEVIESMERTRKLNVTTT
ncbi:hypothetical protein WG8_1291 [Paenibacillus sp. Aloe-11]|nr:hypothetical protein WG8_1291 [Paenibacillus sp. Aloe-11]